MPDAKNDCLIGFGSNLGDPQSMFQRACDHLGNSFPNSEIATSKPLITSPVGGPEGQDDYLNSVFRLSTDLDPVNVHEQLVRIETELGRERRTRWGARKVDLDLLLVGTLIVDQPKLQVPHPRMSFRRFVLEPAAEIAGEMMHPICQMSIGELLDRISCPKKELVWISDNENSGRLVDQCHQLQNWKVFGDWEDSLEPNLVVLDSNSSKSARMMESIKAPKLNLSGLSDAAKLVELTAAINAMDVPDNG